MEKQSMQLYLGDLKNTRVHVTSRDPLSFTVNGCSGLQAYREQLFEQQFAALEYCAHLVQDREVHAGWRCCGASATPSSWTRSNAPAVPVFMSVRVGKKMSVCQDEPLRLALEDYIVEQQESLDLVSGVLLPEEAESDFPFRFVGERTEFVRFVRALFITDRIVPVGGAKMLHCVRHLMRLLHVPEGNNLSNVINKLVCTDNQLRFFDKFRRDLEKQILSGR